MPQACFLLFVVTFVLLGIEPTHRAAWMLEHLPTAVMAALTIRLMRRQALSDRAWIQVTIFALLHLYGAHYTYAKTPLGFALRDALVLSRNHYDRVVHFAFGLLFLRPVRELLFPEGKRAELGHELLVASAFIAAISLSYEQLEWLTAIIVDPSAGIAFLGTQGDEWDAQKDATAATLGGLVALLPELRGPRGIAPTDPTDGSRLPRDDGLRGHLREVPGRLLERVREPTDDLIRRPRPCRPHMSVAPAALALPLHPMSIMRTWPACPGLPDEPSARAALSLRRRAR